jgi:FkbM family methyltransferase
MTKLTQLAQQATRGIKMLGCYHNWPSALADRLGFVKERPTMYHLRDGVSLIGRSGTLDVRLVNEIWLDRIYDTGLASNIEPDWVILDLGANKGYFSVRAALKASRVISAEPNPISHALCKANITVNGFAEKVHLHQVAVAEKEGQITFSIAEDSACCTTLHRPDVTHTITVDAVTVPKLIGDIEKIDLMKMDIEGSEVALLLDPASGEWLQKVRRIAMEYHPMFYSEEVRLSMVHRLENLGFEVITCPERYMMFARKHGE